MRGFWNWPWGPLVAQVSFPALSAPRLGRRIVLTHSLICPALIWPPLRGEIAAAGAGYRQESPQ